MPFPQKFLFFSKKLVFVGKYPKRVFFSKSIHARVPRKNEQHFSIFLAHWLDCCITERRGAKKSLRNTDRQVHAFPRLETGHFLMFEFDKNNDTHTHTPSSPMEKSAPISIIMHGVSCLSSQRRAHASVCTHYNKIDVVVVIVAFIFTFAYFQRFTLYYYYSSPPPPPPRTPPPLSRRARTQKGSGADVEVRLGLELRPCSMYPHTVNFCYIHYTHTCT